MINTQNIINTSDEIFNNIFTDVDTKEEEEYQNIMENKAVDISDYNFGKRQKISPHGVMVLVLEHPGKLRLKDYNARQCNHCSRKDMDDFDFVVNTNHKKKLDYKDKLEQPDFLKVWDRNPLRNLVHFYIQWRELIFVLFRS